MEALKGRERQRADTLAHQPARKPIPRPRYRNDADAEVVVVEGPPPP